jgi:uncharacterized protein YecE (DUF72 family)
MRMRQQATIRVGTSGWSYPSGPGTWNGIFYPKPRPRGFDELAYYAEHFDTVEVNATFYGQPRASVTRTWAERTPARFDFALKLYQKFTHPNMFKERELQKAPGSANSLLDLVATVTQNDIDTFKEGVEPLASAGKLGALLAQFPASFKYSVESVAYLDALLRAFGEYPLAIELRHNTWSDHFAEAIVLLNSHGAALAQIDEPKFKTSIRQNQLPNIQGFYYLRLHGRNAKKWWRHDHKDERYDYLYAAEELQEFASVLTSVQPLVKKDARAYFNNHFAAKSVANAATVKAIVGQPVEGDYEPELVERYTEFAATLASARR